MENMELYGVMAVPLVTGVVQMATGAGLPKRYAPILSLAIGVTIGVVGFADGNLTQGFVVGSAIGLSASGFYSAIRVPAKKGFPIPKKLQEVLTQLQNDDEGE